MAARRNKSQAKRNNGGGGGGVPGWGWLVMGVALGVGAFLIAPKFLGSGGDFFRPQPDADAQPPAIDATASADNAPIAQGDDTAQTEAATAKPEAPKEQDYDFYTLLPGEETAVSDAELADRTRAEEARQTQNTTRPTTPDTTAATPADTTRPQAIDTAPPPAIDAPPAKPKPTASVPETAKADAVRDDDSRYLLQAGAFAASGDAEAMKAKIAFLGLSARVESAQIGGKTVYRVRMGPYGSATELAEAKKKLSGGGLPAMAVKTR